MMSYLSPSMGEKITAHINEKWENGCPMCGSRKWGLSPRMYELTPYPIPQSDCEPSSICPRGRGVWPTIIVACDNCAACVFLNSILCGLLTDDGWEDKENEHI